MKKLFVLATFCGSLAGCANLSDVRNAQVASFASDSTTPAAQEGPIFRTLFQAGDRAQPVSNAVRELWGNNGSLTSVSLPRTPEVGTPRPLDLFSDRSGAFSN